MKNPKPMLANIIKLCADCRHPKANHWKGLGACDTRSGSGRYTNVCACKRYRRTKA